MSNKVSPFDEDLVEEKTLPRKNFDTRFESASIDEINDLIDEVTMSRGN